MAVWASFRVRETLIADREKIQNNAGELRGDEKLIESGVEEASFNMGNAKSGLVRGTSMEQSVLQWISQYGYAGIFFLLMLGIIGLPIPDETLLTFSGYLIFKGQLQIAPTMISAFLGSICGITVSYLLGRTGGRALMLRYGSCLHITMDKIDRVHEWLECRGRWGLFLGYFIPGVRHLTAFVAGTSQMRFTIFAAFAYSGGLFWTTSFITAGFFMGKEWVQVAASVRQWILIAVALVGCALLVHTYLLHRRIDRRN